MVQVKVKLVLRVKNLKCTLTAYCGTFLRKVYVITVKKKKNNNKEKIIEKKKRKERAMTGKRCK